MAVKKSYVKELARKAAEAKNGLKTTENRDVTEHVKSFEMTEVIPFEGGESVTGRIRSIKQPRGGYVSIKQFEKVELKDGKKLYEEENIHGSIIGMVVDYMVRFLQGEKKEEAFAISLGGAMVAEKMLHKDQFLYAFSLLKNINGLDDDSIINACKLVTFDCWKRSPMNAIAAKTAGDINPNKETIENIRILIQRCMNFFEKYGPITANGFTFEPENGDIELYHKMIITHKGTFGGYTPMICSGDGDYLTSDTLWDLKVSKTKPSTQHTLQILIYWIMGKHSGKIIFENINKIGIYNARFNTIYTLDIKKIPTEVIKQVETEVICYE